MSEETKRPRGVNSEAFADIVEGRRRCLTCEELAMVARCEREDSPKGDELKALIARYREHIVDDGCVDCQELYEAEMLVSSAAARAADDAIATATNPDATRPTTPANVWSHDGTASEAHSA